MPSRSWRTSAPRGVESIDSLTCLGGDGGSTTVFGGGAGGGGGCAASTAGAIATGSSVFAELTFQYAMPPPTSATAINAGPSQRALLGTGGTVTGIIGASSPDDLP